MYGEQYVSAHVQRRKRAEEWGIYEPPPGPSLICLNIGLSQYEI